MKILILLLLFIFIYSKENDFLIFPLHRIDLPSKSIRLLKSEFFENVPLHGNFQKIGYLILLFF